MPSSPSSESAARKLPWRQLMILVVVRLAEPIAYASVLPYLPSMILSFEGVNPADVGFWAGTAAAIFSLAECISAIPWGSLSDRLGRKPVLLFGMFSTMITSLIWGVSNSLFMALFIRAVSGAGNGNVGIVRTMVAELCPKKEMQPRAFSIMPIVYTVGSVIGPILGGAMANPLRRPPNDKTDGPFLWRHPFALPNLVIGGFFLVGMAIGVLFLEETLESKRNRRDLGLVVGKKLANFTNNTVTKLKHIIHGGPVYAPLSNVTENYQSREAEEDVEYTVKESASKKGHRLSYKAVLSKQTVLHLTSFTLLATHTAGFEQIASVFLHHPRNGGVASDLTVLPFQSNRGFGLETSAIGLMFSIGGIVSILVQFVVFPPVVKRFGTLPLLRALLAIQPLFYILSPYTALITNPVLAETAFITLWTVRSGLIIMTFPCSIILVTNSTTSMRVLGTVNGIATATNAIGRALGPTVTGWLFTWGVHNDRIVAPFMFLATLSLLNLIPLIWAVEGDGFGDEPDTAAEEDEEQPFIPDGDIDEDDVRLEDFSIQEKL